MPIIDVEGVVSLRHTHKISQRAEVGAGQVFYAREGSDWAIAPQPSDASVRRIGIVGEARLAAHFAALARHDFEARLTAATSEDCVSPR